MRARQCALFFFCNGSLFFAVKEIVSFLLAGYLQSSEKRDEFCFWIQRDLSGGIYSFTAEAGSDQPESTVSPGYVAGPSRPRSVAGWCLSNLADRDWLSR